MVPQNYDQGQNLTTFLALYGHTDWKGAARRPVQNMLGYCLYDPGVKHWYPSHMTQCELAAALEWSVEAQTLPSCSTQKLPIL